MNTLSYSLIHLEPLKPGTPGTQEPFLNDVVRSAHLSTMHCAQASYYS
jgi:hypothetical protein